DTRIAAGIRREREFRSVRRNAGGNRRVTESHDLLLILAVVVHLPDFLRARAVGNEVDVAAKKTLATEFSDDVRRELMRDFARSGLVDGSEVAFSQQLSCRHR